MEEEKTSSLSAAKSYEEMASFWETHSTADFDDQTFEVEMEFEPSARRAVVDIEPDLMKELREIANQRLVSLQTLVNLWLSQRVEQIKSQTEERRPEHLVSEVHTPYMINPADEAIGKHTIIIHRENRPVAVVVPYEEYQALTHQVPIPLSTPDPEFEKQWQAFQRLYPELLEKYEGKWVGIVNEQVAVVGLDFATVSKQIDQKFGAVPQCIGEVLKQPRVYRMTTRRIVRREI